MDNNKPHLVNTFKCDLNQLCSVEHQKVEDRVIKVFNQSLHSVLNAFSDKYFVNQDLLQSQLVLDLGEIEEADLERVLPIRFEHALQEWLIDYKKKSGEKHEQSEEEYRFLHPLIYYLLNGTYPWYGRKRQPFKSAWEQEIKKRSFPSLIYGVLWPNFAIKRFVQLAYLQLLEKTLNRLIPNDSVFVISYHKELLKQKEKNRIRLSVSKTDFHKVVWEFTLRYIFNAKGSRFSRKQFVKYHLQMLARHYNLSFGAFYSLFFEAIDQIDFYKKDQIRLLDILEELRLEMLGKRHKEGIRFFDEKDDDRNLTINEIEQLLKTKSSFQRDHKLRAWLIEGEGIKRIKQHWLNPLKIQYLFEVSVILVGSKNKAFIYKYHEQLLKVNQQEEQQTNHNSFHRAIWSFTLDYFSQHFSSFFDARNFVRFHSRKLAHHFNLDEHRFLLKLLKSVMETRLSSSPQMAMLSQVLLEVKEEVLEQEHRTKREEIELAWKRLIRVYQREDFQSDRERYLFFRSWAIDFIEEYGFNQEFPLKFLLHFAKKQSGTTPKKLLYDLKTVVKYDSSFKERNSELEWSVDPNFESKRSLEHYRNEIQSFRLRRDKPQLSFHLLQRLLNYTDVLSTEDVKHLKALFELKNVQQDFILKWIYRLNQRQLEALIRLIYGEEAQWIIDMYTLFDQTIDQRRKKSTTVLFFQVLFRHRGKQTFKSIWLKLLKRFATKLKISEQDLEHKLEMTMISLLKEKFYSFNYLSFLKSKDRIDQKQKKPTKFEHLGDFTQLRKEELESLSITQLRWLENALSQTLFQPINDWSQFLIKHKPVLFHLRKHSGSFRKLFETRKKLEAYRLFLTLEWGGDEELVDFLMFMENKAAIRDFEFKKLGRDKMKRLMQYVFRQGLDQWLKLSTTSKLNFINHIPLADVSVLQYYFHELQYIYQHIPSIYRPHAFFIFEKLFWQEVFRELLRGGNIWDVFKGWLTFMHLQLHYTGVQLMKFESKLNLQQKADWQKIIDKIEELISQDKKALTDHFDEPPMNKESEKEEQAKEGFDDDMDLDHVGLILLHPFLKQIFVNLDYLDHEKQFYDEARTVKAILLLHYMACGEKFGEGEIEEDELAFPKVLCGKAVNDVLDLPDYVEEEAYEMVDNMLNACIQHWEKLKGSSISSLQNTFLKRRGKLEAKDGALQLYVEKSGTDILLDFLPWSYSIINLPWLEQAIFVSWR